MNTFEHMKYKNYCFCKLSPLLTVSFFLIIELGILIKKKNAILMNSVNKSL